MLVQVVERQTGRLLCSRSVDVHPGRRGRDDETPALIQQLREPGEEALRLGKSAKKIGRMDEIKSPQVMPQGHCIANFERNPVRVDSPGPAGLESLRQVHFPVSPISRLPLIPDQFGGFNKTGREIDPDHFGGKTGKFECGSAHRTSQVKRPSDGRVLSGRFDRGYRELQASRRKPSCLKTGPVQNLCG